MTDLDHAYATADYWRWQETRASDHPRPRKRRAFCRAEFNRWKQAVNALKANGFPAPLADLIGAPAWSRASG